MQVWWFGVSVGWWFGMICDFGVVSLCHFMLCCSSSFRFSLGWQFAAIWGGRSSQIAVGLRLDQGRAVDGGLGGSESRSGLVQGGCRLGLEWWFGVVVWIRLRSFGFKKVQGRAVGLQANQGR